MQFCETTSVPFKADSINSFKFLLLTFKFQIRVIRTEMFQNNNGVGF